MKEHDYSCELLSYREGIFDELYEVEVKSHKSPWTYDEIKSFFSYNYHVIGLLYKGNLVGYSLISVIFEDCELLSIGVISEHRGNGQGRALLNKTLEIAKGLNATKVFLEVRTKNEVAINLYKSIGFVKIGLRKGYYPKTKYEDLDDALTMQLNL